LVLLGVQNVASKFSGHTVCRFDHENREFVLERKNNFYISKAEPGILGD
jgi:hypothetical protein